MTAIAPDAMIVLTDTADWILIAMGVSNNGNATAAPLLILTMVARIGAMIVTEIPNIGTVSTGKLRAVEYSRILERGRGIAAARVFFSEPKLFVLRAILSCYSSASSKWREREDRTPAVTKIADSRSASKGLDNLFAGAELVIHETYADRRLNKSLFNGEQVFHPLPAKASFQDVIAVSFFHIN